MTFRKLKLNQKGYTLIELAVATAVMAVLATTVVIANQFVNKQGVANADRTFATEKAVQMYEELRTLVSGNESVGAGVLNDYNNFNTFDYVLTTDPNVDTGTNGGAAGNPGDPLSGNFKSDGHWRYMRQVEVNPVANDTQARQVTVKVYLYPGDYAVLSSPITQTGPLLATVGGILRTSQQPNVPTQVLDIYVLQINNIPSWWSVLPTLAGYMQAAVSDLKSRLLGYQVRVHYITRTSYGRDPQYQPETNSFSKPSDTTHQQWVYYYPGITPQDSTAGGNFWYYDPQTSEDVNSVLRTGNFMVDGASYPVSTTQLDNSENISYSVADQYNNAMRYPDELAAYAAVTTQTALAVASGIVSPEFAQGVSEISERMLMEGMLSQPASFANSMIINLHGELLPLPPLRNYSDAAKDPGDQLISCAVTNGVSVVCNIPASNGVSQDMNVRVVTHPELLYYPVSISGATTATAVTVRLRVYAYYDGEDTGGVLPTGDPRVPAISLFLPDASVSVIGVTAIVGSSTVTYGYEAVTQTLPSIPPTSWNSGLVPRDAAGNPMSMSVSYIGSGNKQTLITLYNTPLRSAIYATGSKGGLNPADVLYGAEYIPCSPDQSSSSSNLTAANYYANSYNFGNDLGSDNAVTASNNPKNTARWIISLAMPVSQIYANGVTLFNGTYGGSGLPATIGGMHTIETRLGNGVTSSTFLTSANIPVTVIPNLSRTYVWTGAGAAAMPPYTEQYQFLGDPRDCPYFDVKAGGVSIAGAAVTIGPNAYNWWFKGTGTANMTSDGYVSFGAAGANNWYNSADGAGGNLNIDLPRYYQIIRQGLLKTTSIWTGTNGWSWFYFGLGGEYGADQYPRLNGVTIMDDSFRTSGTGVAANFNDLYQGDGVDGSHGNGLFVASNVTGSNSVTWYQRSWLGEIYPDRAYMGSWLTNGNLPSIANNTLTAAVTTVTGNYYCEPMVKVALPAGSPSDDGFAGVTFWANPGGYGSESFYDGNNITTTNTFKHESTDHNGNELQLAVTTYNVFPFPMPAVVDVNREWDFSGGNPPESGIAPYNSGAMTTTLDIPTITSHNGSSGVTSRLFYDYNGNGTATSPYGSGVVRMKQVNGGTTQIGYVIETGTAPSGSIGPQTLAETALVLAMRTFLDGGQMAVTGAVGHIVQLPLVKIFLASAVHQYNQSQGISFTVASPVTATSNGGGAVSVGMPVTDIWWGYNPNGLASYYTEEYPNYTQPMTLETGMYQEAVSVIYNLKYTNGTSWYFVQDGSAAVSGVCDCDLSNVYNGSNLNGHAVTNIAPWTYNWPVATGGSGHTVLTQGSYQLMVEAYRQNYGEHYSYDIQNLVVSW
jgi:prepilin-type N-terminal cleavage/methylation domain-containing protein